MTTYQKHDFYMPILIKFNALKTKRAFFEGDIGIHDYSQYFTVRTEPHSNKRNSSRAEGGIPGRMTEFQGKRRNSGAKGETPRQRANLQNCNY